MKYLYLIAIFVTFGMQQAKAVMPDGSDAPDWTLTDLDGNTHNLHSILNSGKHVILDFSATWCGPCWNYHNTHTLSTLWNLYGPNGTDEIMVFFIEADVNTTTPCLYGLPSCQGGTQGNWVAGTPYPIIDLLNNTVRNQYQITYFPTLYGIRAQDKRVFEVGQRSVSQWETWLFDSFNMDYSATITDNTCRGNGSVELDVTGGFNSIFYQWSNGMLTSTISNLQSGSYSCRISDGNGFFIDTEDYVVDGVPDLEVSLVEQTNISCFGESDGILEVAGEGGGGGYTYEWSNGESSTRIEDLFPGNYSVTILDTYDCDVTQQFSITQPTALFGTAYPNDAPCTGDGGYVEIAGLFGTAPYLYDMGGTPQSDPYFYNLQPGDYNYNVTDANGCLFEGEFEIDQIPGPIAMAEAQDDLSCVVLQATVTGNGSSTGPNITYLWTTADGNIVSGNNTINAMVNEAGTYTLKVTNISNNCFTEATTLVESTVLLPVALVADGTPLTCSLVETTLDGTESSQGPEFTYLWTTGNGNIVSGETTLLAVVDEPGDYTLQVTNTSNGCITTTTENLEENIAQPSLSVTDGEITCTTTSVELCGTTDEGLTIVWQVGEDQITAECVTVSVVGTYEATVVGENGCSTTSTATVTASADLPQVAIQQPDEVTCVVPEITLTATLDGNEQDFTILWSTQNGNIVSGENTLSPVVNRGGTYTLNVVNNTNGCSATRLAVVEEDTDLAVSDFNHVQDGIDLLLTSAVLGTYTSILWDLGNGNTSTESNVTVQYPLTGIYTICLTATNDCGDDTKCIDVLYVTRLSAQVTSSNVKCFGGSDGTITVTATGGLPDYEIGYTSDDPRAPGMVREFTGLTAGIYYIIVTDAQGTVFNITQEISEPTEIKQVSVDIINDVDSGNEGSVTPTISGGTGNYTYLWSNGSTESKLDNIGAGEYTVVVTDENGCQKEFGPYIVENTTNANDISFVRDFNISPNPASEKVVVTVHFVNEVKNGVLSIYNSMGQMVSTQTFNGDIHKTIDISGFTNGLYTVEIRDYKTSTTRKLIVVR